MKVYNYDRLTGEYLGEVDADPSPMEPGKFLVPAFSTPTAPPAADGNKVPTFDRAKSRWVLVERVVEAPAAAPAPSAVDVTEAMRNTVRGYVQSYAVALDFDSIEEAMTYADEPAVPKYQMQARALRAWRSLVWFEFDRILAEIKGGKPAPANPDALIELLPALVMPNVSELASVRSKAEDIPAEVAAYMHAQRERLEAEAEQRAADLAAQRRADAAAQAEGEAAAAAAAAAAADTESQQPQPE